MKKKSNQTTREWYIIRYDIQKLNGYWHNNVEETVILDIPFGQKEKCSHEQAGKVIQAKYPGCKIICITYV